MIPFVVPLYPIQSHTLFVRLWLFYFSPYENKFSTAKIKKPTTAW